MKSGEFFFTWKATFKYCAVHFRGCTGACSNVHHIRGRTGNYFHDERFFLPVCKNCHILIHGELIRLARTIGYIGGNGNYLVYKNRRIADFPTTRTLIRKLKEQEKNLAGLVWEN